MKRFYAPTKEAHLMKVEGVVVEVVNVKESLKLEIVAKLVSLRLRRRLYQLREQS